MKFSDSSRPLVLVRAALRRLSAAEVRQASRPTTSRSSTARTSRKRNFDDLLAVQKREHEGAGAGVPGGRLDAVRAAAHEPSCNVLVQEAELAAAGEEARDHRQPAEVQTAARLASRRRSSAAARRSTRQS